METPRIIQLCSRLAVLQTDLNQQIDRLNLRLHVDTTETIVLNKALQNIVDRKKEKERHLKRWKIEIKEIIDTVIDADSL